MRRLNVRRRPSRCESHRATLKQARQAPTVVGRHGRGPAWRDGTPASGDDPVSQSIRRTIEAYFFSDRALLRKL
jgi:hypothetical protein